MSSIVFNGKTVATDLTEDQVWHWYLDKLKETLKEKKCQFSIGFYGLVITDNNSWLEWLTIEGNKNAKETSYC